MKCPHCGKELAISKKDSSYGLCHTCKKRYKLPSQQQTYSNIPPKHIREKSERTIRENYRNMLEIEDEEQSHSYYHDHSVSSHYRRGSIYFSVFQISLQTAKRIAASTISMPAILSITVFLQKFTALS